MTNSELNELVEKIVQRVLARVRADADLQRLLSREGYSITALQEKTLSQRLADQDTPSKKLYTEQDILELAKKGSKNLVASKQAIFTPSALDAAKNKSIKIIRK